MSISHKEMMAQQSIEIQSAAKKRSEEIIAQHITLGQLRQKLGLTQISVAEKCGKTQPTIAALENAEDPRISSIATYLAAMECEFDIVGRYPDGQEFRIQLNAD